MPNSARWAGRSALVVDDSRSHRAAAEAVLLALGFGRIFQAEDGQAALDVLKANESIDLIITDLNMPGMDGVELLGRLVKQERRYFVIVMSAVSQDVLDTVQGIAEDTKLELLAVLPKPIRVVEMHNLLGGCDPEHHAVGHARSLVEFTHAEVDAALQAEQLVPFFQPLVHMKDRSLKGFEVLVRWLHPEHGVVPPLGFVQHLEDGDLGVRFFYAFVDRICKAVKEVLAQNSALQFAINLPVPLLATERLADQMQSIVQAHGLSCSNFVVEVTETTLMSNLAESLGTLARLRLKGFGLAMDDYGTGYSSMKQLSRCPFSELKIDREFVHNAISSPKKTAILTSAISMSQKLNLLTVAEGVETSDDWRELESLGCDVAQGYYVSRPFPDDQLLAWIAEWKLDYAV